MKINLYHIMLCAALLSLVASNTSVASSAEPSEKQEQSYLDYLKNYGQKLGLLGVGGLATRTGMRYIAPETSNYGTYFQQGLGSLKNAASSIGTGAAGWVGGHARQLTNAAFGSGPVAQAVAPKAVPVGMIQLLQRLVKQDPEKAIEVVKSIPGFSDTAIGAAIIAAATAAIFAGGAYFFGWNPIESTKSAFNKVSTMNLVPDFLASPYRRFNNTKQLITRTQDMIDTDFRTYKEAAESARCAASQSENALNTAVQAEAVHKLKELVQLHKNITSNIETIEKNKTTIFDQIRTEIATLERYIRNTNTQSEPIRERLREIERLLSSSSSTLVEDQEKLKLEEANLKIQLEPLNEQIKAHEKEIENLRKLEEDTSRLDTLTAPKLDPSMRCPSSGSSESARL